MKKINKYILIILILGGVLLLSNAIFTFSKYISNIIWEYHLQSKGFYFSSDHLDNNKINKDISWNGQKVYFNVKNSINQNLITEYDITYKVTCEIEENPDLKCYLNGKNSNEIEGVLSSNQICINNTSDGVDVNNFSKSECELEGYEWQQQVTIKDLYFELILLNQEKEITDVTVNISIESIKPYKKNISGKFVVTKEKTLDNNIISDYKDYDKHGLLTITNTYLEAKNVTISWDSNLLLIDNYDFNLTNVVVDEEGYIKSLDINMSPFTNISFKFYKRMPKQSYDISLFKIE